MGQDVDIAILKGENIAQLFKDLEEVDKDATDESIFLRGRPDLEFAKKIGRMLDQISYIDDCDTLGHREDGADIHRALVSVHQKLLEFYVSAYGLLMKRGARLVLAAISDTGTLPDIVKDLLEQAEHLQKIVEKATLDIVQDIKAMLYDEKTDRDVTAVAEVAELVDHQGVMVLIQPFVASVDFSDLKKHQVILVHQSIKEFILDGWVSSRRGLQTVEKFPPAGSKTATPTNTLKLEKSIFNIYIRYLLLDEINNVPLFSDEQFAIEELPKDVDLFSDDNDAGVYNADCSWENWEEGMIRYDPADRGLGELFVYASCHWISHFRSITTEPLPDLSSVEKLCQANSTRLHNWTSQNSRPDCVVQARFEFDGSLYDPLSITSLYGSEALLLKMLETCEFDSEKFLPNTAMLAADQILQWGDLSRLRMLFFGRGTGHHLRNLEFFRLIINSWRFPDGIPQRDCQNRTALMRVVANPASLHNRVESARILLIHQSALSTNDQQEVLQMAEQMHDEGICNLLSEFSQVSLD